jgi:hypothetical protein
MPEKRTDRRRFGDTSEFFESSETIAAQPGAIVSPKAAVGAKYYFRSISARARRASLARGS